jgi:hypothetical protein
MAGSIADEKHQFGSEAKLYYLASASKSSRDLGDAMLIEIVNILTSLVVVIVMV